MAASGFTPISLYYSTTAAAEPTAGNLVSGELAINIADGKLFYKNSSGNVRLLSIGYGSSTVTPTNGGVQYGTGSALALTAAGSSGQILRSNGAAAPTWADLSSLGVNTISFGSTGLTPSTATSGAVTVAGTLITSNGGTGLSSYTLGDMVYYSAGTTLTKLTIGAANRVMTSNGSAPQWVDSLTGLSSVSSTAFTENGYPVVSQADIGTAPNEIPLNQYLGDLAYQDSAAVTVGSLTASGNIILSTAGAGIDFSADSNAAGMTSELLSDYEEGTFTPTITSGFTTPGYSLNAGRYTKVGRICYFAFRVGVNTGTRNANILQMTLPFTSINDSSQSNAGGAWFSYVNAVVGSTTTNLPTLYNGANTNILQFYKTDGNNFTGNDLSSAVPEFYIHGWMTCA